MVPVLIGLGAAALGSLLSTGCVVEDKKEYEARRERELPDLPPNALGLDLPIECNANECRHAGEASAFKFRIAKKYLPNYQVSCKDYFSDFGSYQRTVCRITSLNVFSNEASASNSVSNDYTVTPEQKIAGKSVEGAVAVGSSGAIAAYALGGPVAWVAGAGALIGAGLGYVEATDKKVDQNKK